MSKNKKTPLLYYAIPIWIIIIALAIWESRKTEEKEADLRKAFTGTWVGVPHTDAGEGFPMRFTLRADEGFVGVLVSAQDNSPVVVTGRWKINDSPVGPLLGVVVNGELIYSGKVLHMDTNQFTTESSGAVTVWTRVADSHR